MKTSILFIPLFLFLGLSSCKKEAQTNCETDYLIFGHFYGFCIGETCVETYKLTDTKLYEDSNDVYFGEGPFTFLELSQSKFTLVEDLESFIPQGLIALPDSTFGCPDCADQGGVFIQYAHDGVVQSWRIDQSAPFFLEDFVDKVNEKITLINQ